MDSRKSFLTGMTERNRTKFVLQPHSDKPDVTVIEVYSPEHQGGNLIGVIYPSADGFTFVSKYLSDSTVVVMDTHIVPALVVRIQDHHG